MEDKGLGTNALLLLHDGLQNALTATREEASDARASASAAL